MFLWTNRKLVKFINSIALIWKFFLFSVLLSFCVCWRVFHSTLNSPEREKAQKIKRRPPWTEEKFFAMKFRVDSKEKLRYHILLHIYTLNTICKSIVQLQHWFWATSWGVLRQIYTFSSWLNNFLWFFPYMPFRRFAKRFSLPLSVYSCTLNTQTVWGSLFEGFFSHTIYTIHMGPLHVCTSCSSRGEIFPSVIAWPLS